MRISKDDLLKRLLTTQDVCLSTFIYLTVVQGAQWLGYLPAGALHLLLPLTLVVILLAVFASLRSDARLRKQTLATQCWFALRYTFIVVGGLLFFLYLIQADVSGLEETLVGFALLLSSGLLLNRILLKWWYLTRRREKPVNFLKVMVVGAGPRARRFLKTYQDTSEWGLDVIAILDPDPEYHGSEILGSKVRGGLDLVPEILSRNVVDEVLFCLPRRQIDDLESIARLCADEGVTVKLLADLYDIESGDVRLERAGTLPLLSFEPVSHGETQIVAKRLLDLLLTTLALPLVLPLMLVIAAAIKLDSRGPVFFVQERVGLHKRRFGMVKFRSMQRDAESRMSEIEHLNEADGPIFKIVHDPRITRVGHFLRRSSLDELPQLFNVLLGQMSLVGPRPLSVRDVERFDRSIQRKRFSVRPGLICTREISGRSRLSFDRWLELDLEYIDHWSLWVDLKILLKAIPAVLRGDGAH